MAFIDRQFFKEQIYATTHCIISSILIWELDVTIHNFDEYAKIDIYLSEKDDCTVIILQKIHIVKNFKIKMLVSMNILTSKNIIMNLLKKMTVIVSYNNIKVLFTITTKFNFQIQHTILVKQHTVVLSQSNFIVIMI